MRRLIETKDRALDCARKTAGALSRACSAAVMLVAIAALGLTLQAMTADGARAQTRALKLFHLHTKEKATIVFKRNGRYDQAGLKKLNMFLRDWRRGEPTRMDPRLFDLIWEVYQKAGARDYIHVVSAYRSPATNSMLRSRSKGVAEKSQHIQGKAMDFFIPGVKLAKLREVGMKFEVGGVGYYPRSGSPFVHMDVGSVRSWPRMSRAELARLFPNGKTLHRPAEGGQMPGFNQAMADYKKRVGKNAILVAGGGSENTDNDSPGRRKGLLATLFGGDENEETLVEADIATAKEAAPAEVPKEAAEPVVVAAAEPELDIKAPVPGSRPAFAAEPEQPAVETALVAPESNPAEAAMLAAMAKPTPEDEPAFTDLSTMKVPVPTMLGARNRNGDAETDGVMTASADGEIPDDLGTVPVPDQRPILAEADIDADLNQGVDLTNDEIAALAAEASVGTPAIETSTDESEADISDSLDVPADDPAGLSEMAALDTQSDVKTRSLELSPQVVQDLEAVRPKKGARPKKADAVAAAPDSEPVVTAPKLTSNMIARWALTNGRVASLSKPVKAPRFVSSTMRARPTTVLATGFSQDTAEVDPARFSGTAVNFIAVKKFNETN